MGAETGGVAISGGVLEVVGVGIGGGVGAFGRETTGTACGREAGDTILGGGVFDGFGAEIGGCVGAFEIGITGVTCCAGGGVLDSFGTAIGGAASISKDTATGSGPGIETSACSLGMRASGRDAS